MQRIAIPLLALLVIPWTMVHGMAAGNTPSLSVDPSQPPPSEQQPENNQADRASSLIESPPTNFPVVRGELVYTQGEFYTVKDEAGGKLRLHVNKDTRRDGVFHVGDKVEIERTISGHATSMKKEADDAILFQGQ